ncbi:hypothetical protein G7Y89_g14142 [Cudoniella acicularis]|uniref:Uncharacterized protein n=1 Tax=Cudoniella acicularis TaxID=354080 RepID=A0A8H4R7Z0_9HELO|nr:hypothetical protein G7Y89_g14142 [Cudoniella acicularis]
MAPGDQIPFPNTIQVLNSNQDSGLYTYSTPRLEPLEPPVELKAPIHVLGFNIDYHQAPKPLLDNSGTRNFIPNTAEPSKSPGSSEYSLSQDDVLHKPAPLGLVPTLQLNGATESFQPGDAVDKKFCFGMVHNTAAKLVDLSPVLLENPGEISLSTERHSLELNFQDHCVMLSSSVAQNFAVLNDRMSKLLHDVRLMSPCNFEAFLDRTVWTNFLGSLSKVEKNAVFLLDIVLYGPANIGQELGEMFTDARVYLQHPYSLDSDIPYNNPHFLKFDRRPYNGTSSHLESGGKEMTESRLLITKSDTSLIAEKFISEITSPSQLRRKMDAIYGTLTRSKKLVRIEADIRVTRKLLPFQHSITGTKVTQRPEETVGGILADDMGLGKTLTVISTIIRTAEHAQSFAKASTYGSNSSYMESSEAVPLIASRSTLVIVPSTRKKVRPLKLEKLLTIVVLIDEWRQEIKLHCDGSLNIIIYHSRGREPNPHVLSESDIVLSTYHTVATEVLDPESPLYRITWFRVVLDEAHTVRNMTTKLFKAVSNLHAKFRWCLTGTPVQNSLEDLASLTTFIRSAQLTNLSEFRKHIINPLIKGTEQGMNNIRLLLDSVCLRRTNTLLQLPDISDEDQFIDFSEPEKALYIATQQQMIKEIKQLGGQDRNAKGYYGIFQLQLQLRRLCNHGTFQKLSSKTPGKHVAFDPEQALLFLQEKREAKCHYCRFEVTGLKGLEERSSGHFTTCGHLICSNCLPRYKKELITGADSRIRCSVCNEIVTEKYLASSGFDDGETNSNAASSRELFEETGISSKISALLKDLKYNPTEGKSIVFSCWTRSLDLAGLHLSSENISFERIDGTYTLSQRLKILENFQSQPLPRILLMTTGTGAIGLNLTIANSVYLLEPQWNPMVESQAIARVLRLGQERKVRVVRYIVVGTVETTMRTQQTRKLDLAKLGWRDED